MHGCLGLIETGQRQRRRMRPFCFVFLQWLTMPNQTEPVANIALSCTSGSKCRGDDVEVT
jgi:hypothetical protein